MERMHYIEAEDKLVIETLYDAAPVIEKNAIDRAQSPEFGRYKGNLTKVASIPVEHLEALKQKGYDLMSPDQEQRRRALCYIQSNEQHWMTVPGRPFAMHRPKWR